LRRRRHAKLPFQEFLQLGRAQPRRWRRHVLPPELDTLLIPADAKEKLRCDEGVLRPIHFRQDQLGGLRYHPLRLAAVHGPQVLAFQRQQEHFLQLFFQLVDWDWLRLFQLLGR
jgi:hypothetical protein